MTVDDPTRRLAEFSSGLRWTDVPERVQSRVADVVIDAIASGLLGQSVGEIPRLASMQQELGSSGSSTVIGGAPTSEMAACLVNGYLITAATICDAHLPTQCHVTPEVLPPAMAVSESRVTSGERFLAAVAAGLEVTTRIGLGLNPPVMAQLGWHAPGITGPFGGAAAVGNLLELSTLEQQYAFGLAASQAAGTLAQWGTITVKFHQARGSVSGLLAGRLAAHGFTSCTDVLTRPVGGLLTSYSDGGDASALVAGLGDEWRLMDVSLRTFPVGALMQAVAAVALDVRAAVPDASEIEAVCVRLPEKAYRMHGDMPWHDAFTSRLSTRYIAAVVLLDDRCGLEQFSDERLASTDVDAFATQRVRVELDASLADGGAAMDVSLRSGQVVRVATNAPPGHPSAPLTRSQVMEKFGAAATSRPLRTSPDMLASQLQGLVGEPDVGSVWAGLRSNDSRDM